MINTAKILEHDFIMCQCFAPLINLGDWWFVEPEVTDEIGAFACRMYGHEAWEKSINSSIILKQMVGEGEQMTINSKVDFSMLQP